MAKEKILLVEGDITFQELLRNRLEARGYLVACAGTAKEALDILKNHWVDLIILAVNLRNGMSGFKLLKEIKKKKKFAKIPIVVQSSRAAMKNTFKKMGTQKFFIKPYSMSSFLKEVRAILKK